MTLSKEQMKIYLSGYYAGYRHATIDHLGGKCSDCEERDPYNLEIHHAEGLCRHDRTLKDLKDLTKLGLKCKTHHLDVTRHKNRGKREKIEVDETQSLNSD